MDAAVVEAIATKELRDSLRTRWFVLYTVALALLAGGLAYVATSFAGYAAYGFGRTAAGLVNLVLLVVPLMGLTAGAQALAGERDRSTLGYLLAQPVTRGEVLLGKYLGLGAALLLAVLVSFGLTGVILAARGIGMDAGGYLTFAGLTLLLALASLSLGCLVSVWAGKAAAALGAAVGLWLTLAFLGDLGLMATAVVARLGIHTVFAVSLLNPLQVFKVAAVAGIQPTLEALGPVGQYAMDLLGAGLVPALMALLVAWAVLPLGVAWTAFSRRDGA